MTRMYDNEIRIGLGDHLKDVHDKETVSRMMSEIMDIRFRDDQFEERLMYAVSWLHDNGVEIGDRLKMSNRLVFSGVYENREVVIKFVTYIGSDIDHRKQQLSEEYIWNKAKENGDATYFAEVFLVDPNGACLVQEKCYGVTRHDDLEGLPMKYLRLAEKYDLSEAEVGYSKENVMKFIDFGM